MSDSQIHLEGTLLLADPSLRDAIFDHSVILLASHTAKDGAFGLILNHPTGHTVGHFLKDKALAPLGNVPVHIGGPVGHEQLTFSAFSWKPDGGLHWEIRLPAETVIERIRQPGTIVRAFVGYTGWSAGQLENELRTSSWITSKPDPALLGATHDASLWTNILRGLSAYHRIVAETPPEPGLN